MSNKINEPTTKHSKICNSNENKESGYVDIELHEGITPKKYIAYLLKRKEITRSGVKSGKLYYKCSIYYKYNSKFSIREFIDENGKDRI